LYEKNPGPDAKSLRGNTSADTSRLPDGRKLTNCFGPLHENLTGGRCRTAAHYNGETLKYSNIATGYGINLRCLNQGVYYRSRHRPKKKSAGRKTNDILKLNFKNA
jgi:hypothetical protein